MQRGSVPGIPPFMRSRKSPSRPSASCSRCSPIRRSRAFAKSPASRNLNIAIGAVASRCGCRSCPSTRSFPAITVHAARRLPTFNGKVCQSCEILTSVGAILPAKKCVLLSSRLRRNVAGEAGDEGLETRQLGQIGEFARVCRRPWRRHDGRTSCATSSWRQIMDEGNVLLVNLAKGRIGEDSSSLLGGLLVTTIGLAAVSRAEIPPDVTCPACIVNRATGKVLGQDDE